MFGHHIKGSDVTYTPEYEIVEIAHYDHLSLDEFSKKPEWYQDYITQAYRTRNQIDAVLAEEQRIKDEKRRAEQEALRMSGGNFR